MHLQSITLRQFRSYPTLEISVDPGLNLFIGPNGSGKTNVIEAIAVLATGSSPRGADPEHLVRWNDTGFAVRGTFAHDSPEAAPVTLEMKYRIGSTRVIRQNDEVGIRLRDLLGKVPLVSFVPEDLALVKGEPELRRRAINMVLMQVDPAYAETLRRYTEAVKSRNAALKQLADGQIPAAALEPWNRAVVNEGLPLCRKRAAFIQEFSVDVARIHHHVSGGKDIIKMEYKPSFAGPWDEAAFDRWHEQMGASLQQEMAMKSTLVGPHRDDVTFLLNDHPARLYGSEGQKRTCAVAFKLAEIPFIESRLGQRPICLLDDVLSELDVDRASHLLDALSKTSQCFVTMTGLESWPQDRPLPASVFKVNEKGVHRDVRSHSHSSAIWRELERIG